MLQAAHERGYEVAKTNFDDPSHGICLCANHHLMYDRELLDIDFEKHEIVIKDKDIIRMPWYRDFLEIYGGKITKRKDRQYALRHSS